jgi:hypothetical protein
MNWQLIDKIFEIRAKWIRVICEKYLDSGGREIEYWRIEKSDSIIIIPLWNNIIVLPSPVFRPGIGRKTLDFPGGRSEEGKSLLSSAKKILVNELQLSSTEDLSINLKPINSNGLLINSSFSNQELYGYHANIESKNNIIGKDNLTFPCNTEGINELYSRFECLQCRALLLEFYYEHYKNS